MTHLIHLNSAKGLKMGRREVLGQALCRWRPEEIVLGAETGIEGILTEGPSVDWPNDKFHERSKVLEDRPPAQPPRRLYR
jgi:hypothetical protein